MKTYKLLKYVFFSPLPLELEHLWAQIFDLLSANEEQKSVAHDLIRHFCYIMIPASFMTSRTQTVRRNMATLTAVFSRLSNVDFEQTRQEKTNKQTPY